ncbi:hypothetical protein KDL01_09380 [Actinospica durhamensis]|uniref:Uncharacterized protein n=1 Tax=Actinospica durhamensis TaxID=1508375 RepID=A0A941ELE1_9ACTN|nr:hypothetical protein [Actinospica durhamensis]MBR7833476.1 hypothetical protein [Actinospica durhamensis]
MTITSLEINGSTVVGGAVVADARETTAASAGAGGVTAASPVDLAELLGPDAIAALASAARVQAAVE